MEGCGDCKSHGRSQEDGVKSRVRTGSELGMPASQMKLGQLCLLMSQLTGQEQGSRPLAHSDWFSQTCLEMLSSPPPQSLRGLEPGKGVSGGRGCVGRRLSPHKSLQLPPPPNQDANSPKQEDAAWSLGRITEARSPGVPAKPQVCSLG